jgi:hypothetical protein
MITLAGVAMEQAGDQFKSIRIPGSRVEFVLNNGKGEWDSPPGNYRIDGPGKYRLEHGHVQRV